MCWQWIIPSGIRRNIKIQVLLVKNSRQKTYVCWNTKKHTKKWNFLFFPEVQNCPYNFGSWGATPSSCRCNFQVHLWIWHSIITCFGVQKPQSQLCTSFLRWIGVNYFSCRKLRCDTRKFQVCVWACVVNQWIITEVVSSSPTVTNMLCSWVRHFAILTPLYPKWKWVPHGAEVWEVNAPRFGEISVGNTEHFPHRMSTIGVNLAQLSWKRDG